MSSSLIKKASVTLRVAISVTSLALLLPTVTAVAEEHMSTLQVIEKVKEKNEGRLIKAERKATDDYPNCHHVKMKTVDGEFKLIRYKCPDS